MYGIVSPVVRVGRKRVGKGKGYIQVRAANAAPSLGLYALKITDFTVRFRKLSWAVAQVSILGTTFLETRPKPLKKYLYVFFVQVSYILC